MRPGLQRDIVRDKTAYKFGRVAMDVLLAFVWIAAVAALVLWFRSLPQLEGPLGLLYFCAVGGSTLMSALGAFVARELVQAIFDIADQALNQGTREASDNPFSGDT